MTDQTPDPWKTVFMRTAGTCVPGMWVYPADEVSEALAAERAQHQQEIAKIDTDFEAVLAAVDAERNDWRDELARRDETIRQLRDWQATVTASLGREGGAFYEDVPKHIREMRAQIATLTQERDEAHKKCADNERGYESLIRRYEHSVSAETARAEAAEARCATLTAALEPFAAAWPSMRDAGATTALLRDYEAAHRALSGVPTP